MIEKFLLPVAMFAGFMFSQPTSSLTVNEQMILDAMVFTRSNDGCGNPLPTIRFEGVNVQIVNDLGSTDMTDGTGNLIIGYNENAPAIPHKRLGSHNLVMGQRNFYNDGVFGSIVTGDTNAVDRPHSAIIASNNSFVEGEFSTVVGSDGGLIIEPLSGPVDFANILGGEQSIINGSHGTITGGMFNFVNDNADHATVGGGLSNFATMPFQVIP